MHRNEGNGDMGFLYLYYSFYEMHRFVKIWFKYFIYKTKQEKFDKLIS